MAQLRARDAERLLGFVADAQSVDGPEPFTTELLDRLAAVMETEFATYLEFDPIHGRSYACVTCSNEKRLSPPPDSTPFRYNPALPDFGGWSDVADRQSRLRFERPLPHWARQYHLVDCVWRRFRISPFDCANLVFHSQECDFSKRDRLKVTVLSPHVSALIRNSRAHRRLADLMEAVDSDEHEPRGFLLLGRGSEIEHASPAAQRLLAEWFGRTAGHLPEPVADWLGSASYGKALRLDGESKRLVVEAPTRGALVVSEEPAPLSDLTPRELEVLRAVALGKSSAEIAGDLWITPATVSKHLEHIYRKLGVTSRTAALAALGQTNALARLTTRAVETA